MTAAPYTILASRVYRLDASPASLCLKDLNLIVVRLEVFDTSTADAIQRTCHAHCVRPDALDASAADDSPESHGTHFSAQGSLDMHAKEFSETHHAEQVRLATFICRGFDMVHCGMYLGVSPELLYCIRGVDEAVAMNRSRRIVLRTTAFNAQFPCTPMARISVTLMRIHKYFLRGYTF